MRAGTARAIGCSAAGIVHTPSGVCRGALSESRRAIRTCSLRACRSHQPGSAASRPASSLHDAAERRRGSGRSRLRHRRRRTEPRCEPGHPALSRRRARIASIASTCLRDDFAHGLRVRGPRPARSGRRRSRRAAVRGGPRMRSSWSSFQSAARNRALLRDPARPIQGLPVAGLCQPPVAQSRWSRAVASLRTRGHIIPARAPCIERRTSREVVNDRLRRKSPNSVFEPPGPGIVGSRRRALPSPGDALLGRDASRRLPARHR